MSRTARTALLSPTIACLLACGSPGGGGEVGEASSPSTGTTNGTTSGTTSSTTTGEVATTTAATTGTSTTSTTTGGEEGNLFLSGRFLNIAHRGGGAQRPEETLPAFENALAVGADVLEFDVHATADGVLVAMHDDTVDRTTNGVGAIADMTFDELRTLDAGYQFTMDGGQTFPYRGMGIVVPTLEEILDASPGEYYLIEIKTVDPPIIDALLASLGEHDALGRVLLAAFAGETLQAVRAANPAVLTSLGVEEMLEFLQNVGNPDYVPPAQFVQAPWELTSAEIVAFAHGKGLKVHPWTVNNLGTMSDLIALEVDGIMTDDPALLAGLVPP